MPYNSHYNSRAQSRETVPAEFELLPSARPVAKRRAAPKTGCHRAALSVTFVYIIFRTLTAAHVPGCRRKEGRRPKRKGAATARRLQLR